MIVTESYVEKNIKNHGFGSKTASRTKIFREDFVWGIKRFFSGIKVFSGELRFFFFLKKIFPKKTIP